MKKHKQLFMEEGGKRKYFSKYIAVKDKLKG